MTKYKLVPVVPTPEMQAFFKRFQIGRCEWNVLLRAAPEPDMEPVAFCDPSEPNARYAFSWPGTDRQHSQTVPLYTAPQPAKMEPLTRAQRDQIISQWHGADADTIITAVEAAYGIGGKP